MGGRIPRHLPPAARMVPRLLRTELLCHGFRARPRPDVGASWNGDGLGAAELRRLGLFGWRGVLRRRLRWRWGRRILGVTAFAGPPHRAASGACERLDRCDHILLDGRPGQGPPRPWHARLCTRREELARRARAFLARPLTAAQLAGIAPAKAAGGTA